MPGSGGPFQKGHAKLGRRKPGLPNHSTQLLKDAILQAATEEGGGDLVAFLRQQAREQPGPFLGLLGRVLPLQLASDSTDRGTITEVSPHRRHQGAGQ